MRKHGEIRIQGRGTNKQHIHLHYMGKVVKEKYAPSWWILYFLDELLYQSDLLTARTEMNSTVSRKKHSENYLTTGTMDNGDVQSLSHDLLCDPMNCSTSGFTVYHQLPDLAQTHVHWVSDAIQPSHPLSSSSPAFSLSQQQGLFQCVSALTGSPSFGTSTSASVLLMNSQGWLTLGLTGLISLLPKGL